MADNTSIGFKFDPQLLAINMRKLSEDLANSLKGKEVSVDKADDWEPLTAEERRLAEEEVRYFEPYLGDVPQPEDSEHDPVNHPKHYNSHPSGVECIEITRHMGFNLGNVIKYIWRDGLKDTEAPLEDLHKALWYLKDEIAMREERGE